MLLVYSSTHGSQQGLNDKEPGQLVPAGIWTLADVLEYGKDQGTCPYFTVRRMVSIISIQYFTWIHVE
jgi:DNA excision repair protein ERCC-2